MAIALWLALPGHSSSRAAGVTIITHGLNSNIDDWVLAMARAMAVYPRFPGARFTCYEIYFTAVDSTYVPAWRRLGGDAPAETDSGELLIKLDWRQLANDDYSTVDVAAMVVPPLLQTNFISELNGHALAELPLHLIGHSRGGSLVAQMSRLLGTNGVWVDQLTTLDPHPLNNDDFNDFPYTVVDAGVRTYENVLFHDNYYQTLNLVFNGEPVAGAYVRELTSLDGGYGGVSASHSDVHLWYHGTIDWRIPADDSVATLGNDERQSWWTQAEDLGASAGFYYSRMGGGDRLATNRPAGAGTSRVRAGYNQRWDLGAGVADNRASLPAPRGDWPNLIRVNLAGPTFMAQGQSNDITLDYQWAGPTANNATVQLYLDDDFNPHNGNERLLHEFLAAGTTATNVGQVTVNFRVALTNSLPGDHALFARISAAGYVRYLYAPERLAVFSSSDAPRLGLMLEPGGQVRLDVTGRAGQRVVLESTGDFQSWQPFATNWLTTDQWSDIGQAVVGDRRFYRGVLR